MTPFKTKEKIIRNKINKKHVRCACLDRGNTCFRKMIKKNLHVIIDAGNSSGRVLKNLIKVVGSGKRCPNADIILSF